MISRLQHSDIKLLRIFIQVAENASFSAAAGILNVNQSTISIQFKLLEQRLGFPLCRRGRAGFELTVEGKKIFEAAKALEQGMSDFIAKTAEVAREVHGDLLIGVSQVMSREYSLAGLPELISRFRARNPNVRIRIEVRTPAELERGIDSGELDIGYMETGFLRRDLDNVPLFDMYSSIYCSTSHPLASVPEKMVDDDIFKRYKSIVFDVSSPFTNPLRQDSSEVTSSSESAIFFIMSGAYIGYLSDALAKPWYEGGHLRRIAPDRYTCNLPGGLVFRKSSLTNPIIMQAIEIARGSRISPY